MLGTKGSRKKEKKKERESERERYKRETTPRKKTVPKKIA
jgi:hypothetical protein